MVSISDVSAATRYPRAMRDGPDLVTEPPDHEFQGETDAYKDGRVTSDEVQYSRSGKATRPDASALARKGQCVIEAQQHYVVRPDANQSSILHEQQRGDGLTARGDIAILHEPARNKVCDER